MVATREKILEAIAKLVGEGKTPTLEGIRAQTGGSFTTIARTLNEWKAQQKAKPTPEGAEKSVPVAVEEKAAIFTKEVWVVAEQVAEERLRAEREELGKLKAEVEAQGAEVMAVADTIATENEGLRSELEKAREELAETQARLTDMQTEAENLRGQCKGLREQFETLVAKIQPQQPQGELA